MKTSDLKDLFRSEIDDAVAPYLWSDTEIAAYMDEAQKMFCRLVGGIQDASSMLCTVDIEIGEPFAAIDPRILRVRRIQRDSDATKLRVISFEDADFEFIQLDDTPGPIDAVIVGMEEDKLRWAKIPQVADTATMIVERLPMNTITSTFKTPLEVHEKHHQPLLKWMKSRAYGKQDSDTFDAQKKAQYEAEFRAYCREAKAEKEVLRHKTRVVHYGGL